MRRTFVLLLILIPILLAFALGAVLFDRGPSAHYQNEMESLRLDTAAKMHIIKVAFWGGLAGTVVLGLVAVLVTLLRYLWLRSDLVPPNAHGLFPLWRGRKGGQTLWHDPNRQLAGSVAYGRGPDGVQTQHLLPAGAEEAQVRITSQAQAAQLVAAASQGASMQRHTRETIQRMAQAPCPTPHMPEVEVIEGEIEPALPDSEERHLLLAVRDDWREE